MRQITIYVIIISIVLLFLGCTRNRETIGLQIESENHNVQISDSVNTDYHLVEVSNVNIYIENSGSMDGYVSGNTDFKKAITKILVLLKDHYDVDKINIYFINSDIHKVSVRGDIENFSLQLNPSTLKIGNVGSSKLNEVFKQVLSNTDRSVISLLFSDCIYSVKGNDTDNLLGHEKLLTMSAFLEKSKQSKVGYTTNIVKLSSGFNGVYYDKNNRSKVINTRRPYYLCVIGASDLMNDFNKAIPIEKDQIEGFEHSYTLTSADHTLNAHWSILATSYNTGRFKSLRERSSGRFIHGIQDVKLNAHTDDNFTIGVALDLSSYPVDAAYLLDPSNYKISKGDFAVVDITPIANAHIKPTDKKYVGSATHIITVRAKATSYSNIEFSLLNTIPKWVYSTSCDDDTTYIDPDATFGFKYMVEGISDAYKRKGSNDYYFTINIPIEKSASSGLLIGFFVLIGLLGLIFLGFLIVKKNKR